MKIITLVLISAGLLSPAFLLAAPVDKPTVKALPAPMWKTSVEGVTEYHLANGLTVLLYPDVSKPTITTNIVYKVGSRQESYGETGMAHLLEHLLFRPSAEFGLKAGSKSPIDVLNGMGAYFNATTWYDRTNYSATFPDSAENLDLMLRMEADRMVHAALAQNDLWNPVTKKGEMTIVRNEFEMGENDPIRVTGERMQSVAFDWHNYGKSSIGTRSDIEHVNISNLRNFYRRYYQPDNAVLMVAGRFDSDKVLAQINRIFGKIPQAKRLLAPTYTSEPAQDGERSVTVRRPGGNQYLAAGYHIPSSNHADAVPLSLLTEILSSASDGRLSKALIDRKLATKVEGGQNSNLEPGFLSFGAVLAKDANFEQAQHSLLDVLENLKAQPITQEELQRAKQSIL
ncbi:MAG: insulinase family protein, partial [Undibacterium sp.]|nr:insulinase family protein [Undibacterium sp.]